MYSVCLMVSKLFLSEYVEESFSSNQKHEKFAVGTHILVNTQNVVISCCCFGEDGYEMYHVLLCMWLCNGLKHFVLPHSCCHCCHGLLIKAPTIQRPILHQKLSEREMPLPYGLAEWESITPSSQCR